jgi:acyl-CoA reductase-like NAD-dependent aldehyde dehydrogenase
VRRFDAQFIAGEWVSGAGGDRLPVTDAATEEVLARIPAGTPADVDRAVRAAAAAFPRWAGTDLAERLAVLERTAQILLRRAEEIAETVAHEVGTPLPSSRVIQAALAITDVRNTVSAAAELRWEEQVGNSLVVREPAGVVAAITPWNYPLHQVCAKVAPALAAGCTVVLKPSELAPLTAYLLAEALAEAGLPAGAVNLVTGTGPVVGEALTAHPMVDMISFTGSVGAGRQVMRAAADGVKRVALELGGKSSLVVLDDADLAAAVDRVVASCFSNNGQTCSALTRLLVPAAWLGDAEAIAAEAAARQLLGDPFDAATTVGPLVSAAQRDRVLGYVHIGLDEGAKLVAGGAERPAGFGRGFYVAPTVLSGVSNEMRVAQEEIFGPVLTLLPYGDEDDAVRQANGTPYGLSGGVWSGDPQHARAVARRLRTGQVSVNGGAFNPAAPFGGYKQSGIGRELGRFGLEEFLETKALHL